MKKFFLVSLLCFLPVICFAQIKDYVCSVRQVFSEQTLKDLDAFAKDMKGNKSLSESLVKYKEGGFGSGFIYVDPKTGNNYVITNRHVVELAETLTVNFIDKNTGDFSDKPYEGLKILAVSSDIDIAILEFPKGVKPFKTGLQIYTNALDDGDSVWTAGFPAFEGKPAWQLGTGSITNATAKLDSLIKSNISTVIQHNAQIDGGSSGGPLLLKDSSAIGGYKVVGINTWKATNRQDTNFAIPAKVVQTFINDAISGKYKEKNNLNELKLRLDDFAKIIANKEAKYEEVLPFISMDYVSKYGKTTFYRVIEKSPYETGRFIASVFIGESPIEGMRYAIAYEIFQEFHLVKASDDKGEVQTYSEPEKIEDSEEWKTTFTLPYKNGSAESTWVCNYGVWQLTYFKSANSKARKLASTQKDAIQFGNLSVSPAGIIDFDLSYSTSLNNKKVLDSFNIGMTMGFDTFTTLYMELNMYENLYKTASNDSNTTFDVVMGGGYRFPMLFDGFVVSPEFAIGGVIGAGHREELEYGSDDYSEEVFNFGLVADLAVRLSYDFGSFAAGVKLGYRYEYLIGYDNSFHKLACGVSISF